jgi:glycosyltransferase involved in cell wall biosynthesis
VRVSVITVCLNSARTIAKALSSVQAQTWPDIEHIVIDGGSVDGTQAIVANSDSPAVIVSEPDRGIYDAMNKGLARASGEVIAFLNADDHYADPTAIERAVSTMRESDVDAVWGDVAFYDPGSGKLVRRYNSGRFSPGRLDQGWMPAHPASFIRRSLFDKVGDFDTSYRIAGDFDFFARLFTRTAPTYLHLPRVLVNMTMGGISTSGWRNTLLLNREVLRACRQNGIASSYARLLKKYPHKLREYLRK